MRLRLPVVCRELHHETDGSECIEHEIGSSVAAGSLHVSISVLLNIPGPKEPIAKGRYRPKAEDDAISEAEEAEESRRTRNDEDRLLIELQKNHRRSHADLARACDFYFDNGEPAKSRLQRALKRLQTDKLVKPDRGFWMLNQAGENAVESLNAENDQREETIDDRAGAHSRKPFAAKIGVKLAPTVPCAQCGETGDVYRIADARVPKGQRHAESLHKDCAKAFFTGAPTAQTTDELLGTRPH
jgi:hypothetical protein